MSTLLVPARSSCRAMGAAVALKKAPWLVSSPNTRLKL
jgi:hypothetical protein